MLSMKRTFRIILSGLLVFFFIACGAPQKQVLRTEKDFRLAFNEAYFKGKAKMEVPVKYGRLDLLSDDYAIEVDRLENFHEAIGQALHYAKETGKKPAVAIFIADEKTGDREKLKYVLRLYKHYNIKVWFINEELEKINSIYVRNKNRKNK